MTDSARSAPEIYDGAWMDGFLQMLQDAGVCAGSPYDVERHESEFMNLEEGDLEDGFDCRICRNKDWIYMWEPGTGKTVARRCSCHGRRALARNLRAHGFAEAIAEKRFSTFRVETAWQRRIFETCRENVGSQKWLYMSGHCGTGKTHLCLAVLLDEAESGKSVRYEPWLLLMERLKDAKKNGRYGEMMQDLLGYDVLYVDDLFKRKNPSESDVVTTFDLINERYTAKKKTIFSSELPLEKLHKLDEALASRIYEMTQGEICFAQRDGMKNARYAKFKAKRIGSEAKDADARVAEKMLRHDGLEKMVGTWEGR